MFFWALFLNCHSDESAWNRTRFGRYTRLFSEAHRSFSLSCKSCLLALSVSMRRTPDVNVRSGSRAGDSFTKGQERNAIGPQEAQQCLPLRAIRMKGDIHRVVMIQAPAIVNRTLTENGNRQRLLECIKEEPLNFPGV